MSFVTGLSDIWCWVPRDFPTGLPGVEDQPTSQPKSQPKSNPKKKKKKTPVCLIFRSGGSVFASSEKTAAFGDENAPPGAAALAAPGVPALLRVTSVTIRTFFEHLRLNSTIPNVSGVPKSFPAAQFIFLKKAEYTANGITHRE